MSSGGLLEHDPIVHVQLSKIWNFKPHHNRNHCILQTLYSMIFMCLVHIKEVLGTKPFKYDEKITQVMHKNCSLILSRSQPTEFFSKYLCISKVLEHVILCHGDYVENGDSSTVQ